MKIAVFALNASFLKDVLQAFNSKFQVKLWKPTGKETLDFLSLNNLLNWCDVAYFEWCQKPFSEALSLQPNCKIVVRLLGVPFYYLAKKIPWSKINLAIAPFPITKKFSEWNLEKPKQIVELPVGVNLNLFNIPKNKVYGKKLAFQATVMRPTKRVYTTIQTFYELLKRNPEWELHICGDWEQGWQVEQRLPYLIAARDLIKNLKLKSKVFMTPFMPKKHWIEWLHDKDIIINNSFREAFGVSLMEAMSSGVYALVNWWDGAEHYYPRKNLFRSQNELLEKIEAWSELPVKAKQKLSLNMRKSAEKYNSEKVAEKICQLINQL